MQPKKSSHKRKPVPAPGFFTVKKHKASRIVLSKDQKRVITSSRHLSATTSQPFPGPSSTPPIPLSEGDTPESDLPTADAFFQAYNESEDIVLCDVPVNRGRSQDDVMAQFRPLRQEYLDEVNRWESRGERCFIEKCQGCGEPSPRFRCRDGCVGGWMYCQECIVKQHAQTPLHWIEEWQDTARSFRRTCLKDLGLRVQLGHAPGSRCIQKAPADRDFTVIHTNGIHNVAVDFCHCGLGVDLEHRQQLMRVGWWPGSIRNPQTCVTRACLRQFHKINTLSKVAVYEYFQALKLLTDNTGTVAVPDKRRVFMAAVRQFRHTVMLRRSGRGHVDNGVATTQQGQLALPCAACPQPGRNLPSDWRQAPAADRFLYRLIVAEDANFRLSNTMASNEVKDPPLGDGWAYFVNRSDYLTYLKSFIDETDISTCSGFAAIFLANLKRVMGLRATGVAAVCCARHNVIRANGMGDLQKGERFANMTYVLAASLRSAGVLDVLHTYDIACIFAVNLWKRNETLPPSLRISIDPSRYISRVPNFHLPAHQTACHAVQSLHFTPGAGRTHAETIEQNWSQLNKAAAQTKMMGPGNRQSTLDDMGGSLNYDRILAFAYLLPSRLIKTIKSYSISQPEFEKLKEGIASYDVSLVSRWLNDEAEWQRDHRKPCPYEYQTRHKTLKEVELELEEEERQATGDGTAIIQACTPRTFIKLGLDIQQSQRLLMVDKLAQKSPSAAQQVELLKRDRALKVRVGRYRKYQRIYMPDLQTHLESLRKRVVDDTEHAENIQLYLPSELDNDRQRTALCAPGLVDVEARLREGEAHEALEDVRRALRARTATNMFRNANVRGNTMATRARGTFDKISKRAHTAKLHYRSARNALLRLRGRGEWEDTLRRLDDDDVRALNERVLTKEEKAERERTRDLSEADFAVVDGIPLAGVVARGEGSRTLSWIWYSVPQDPSLSDPAQNEALRVEFLKSMARRDRDREEIRLLLEEMRRTIASHRADASDWDTRATARSSDDEVLLEGLRSYALEQAGTSRARAEQLETKWKKIRELGEAALNLNFDTLLSVQQTVAQRELQDFHERQNDDAVDEAHAADDFDDDDVL